MEGDHAGKQWKKFMRGLNKKLSDAACIIDFNRRYWYFDICNPDSGNRELDETEASPLYQELMERSAVQPYLEFVQSES